MKSIFTTTVFFLAAILLSGCAMQQGNQGAAQQSPQKTEGQGQFDLTPGSFMPDLVGTWIGDLDFHHKKYGFQKEKGIVKFVFVEQQGRTFKGFKAKVGEEKKFNEWFCGVISLDMKKIYMGEQIDGYTFADVIAPDELAVYHLEDGEDAKAGMYHIKLISKSTRLPWE